MEGMIFQKRYKTKLPIKLSVAFCFISIAVCGQFKITVLDKKDIPAAIKFSGEIVYAAKYHDSLGNHLLIAAETGETKTPDTGAAEGLHSASLHAYHYLFTSDSIKLTWKLTDYIKECGFDISAAFLKNTFSLTDLNRDGKAETWLIYKLACRSDVSPATMKIIMYENGRKSAVRGINKVKSSEKDYTGGEYSFDEAFKKGPAVFRTYASNLWKKNILETWE